VFFLFKQRKTRVNYLLDGGMMEQLQEMQHLIGELMPPAGTDIPASDNTWPGAAGRFMVASAYRLLLEGVTCENETLKNIWELKIPLKMIIFLWLMINNKLLSVDNLKKRRWHIVNRCLLCQDDEETGKHLFNGCTYYSRALFQLSNTVQGDWGKSLWQVIANRWENKQFKRPPGRSYYLKYGRRDAIQHSLKGNAHMAHSRLMVIDVEEQFRRNTQNRP
jgi:zinc-binding in reverse transcriptase